MFNRDEFIFICKSLYNKGLIAGYGGNISVREEEKILITPSGVNKGFIKVEDLLVINFNRDVLEGEGKPSTEALMHIEIYKKRKDLKAIIHSHPPFSVAICISNTKIPNNLLPEATIYLGKISFVKYVKPGDFELAKKVSEKFIDGDVVFMGNHGITVGGKNLLDAYNKTEIVEEISKSFIFSKLLGKVKLIPDEDYKYFLNLYDRLRNSNG